MRLTGKPMIMQFDPFSSETAQAETLGEQLFLGDGRIFRYGKVGAANTSAGKLEQAVAEKPNHYNVAVTATAIGATVVNVTLGATATTINEYDEGFMTVSTAPGVGQTYKIYYTPVIALSTAGNITLSDPVVGAAFTTATRVNLVHNPWNAFIEATTQTARAAGVSMVASVASSTVPTFSWLQTRGYASVLNQGTVALGTYIVPSGSVAGAVAAESSTFATAQATVRVGQATLVAGADTSYNPMFLTID